jgi:hypothetical protein
MGEVNLVSIYSYYGVGGFGYRTPGIANRAGSDVLRGQSIPFLYTVQNDLRSRESQHGKNITSMNKSSMLVDTNAAMPTPTRVGKSNIMSM